MPLDMRCPDPGQASCCSSDTYHTTCQDVCQSELCNRGSLYKDPTQDGGNTGSKKGHLAFLVMSLLEIVCLILGFSLYQLAVVLCGLFARRHHLRSPGFISELGQ